MKSLTIGSIRRRVWIAAVMLTAAACGPMRRGGPDLTASIIFTNESLDQASVYVVAPGSDFRRIGTVIPGRTDTLTVPSDFVNRGTLNIVARLLARSDVPQTGTVSVRAGEVYAVRLQNDGKIMSFLPAS